MNITDAEQKLTRWVAQQSGLTINLQVLRGELPAGMPGVRVCFISGHMGNSTLSEFVAEVRGVFAEPDEARDFAAAVWGALPSYGTDGLMALIGTKDIAFAVEDGWFTATGRIRVIFA